MLYIVKRHIINIYAYMYIFLVDINERTHLEVIRAIMCTSPHKVKLLTANKI